jgi:hypothetical protein
MLLITNISITEKAAITLDVLKATVEPLPGEIFALYYMVSFVEADGTTVEGFRPGYTAGSWKYRDAPMWALARFASGMEFHFMPRFIWRLDEHYSVDLLSERHAIFSIGPRAEPAA